MIQATNLAANLFYRRMNTKNLEISYEVELLVYTQLDRDSRFCKKPPDKPRTKGLGSPSCLLCWRTGDWTTQRMLLPASLPASLPRCWREELAGVLVSSSRIQISKLVCLLATCCHGLKSRPKKNPHKNRKDLFHYFGEHADPYKKLRRCKETLTIPRTYRGCEKIPRRTCTGVVLLYSIWQ